MDLISGSNAVVRIDVINSYDEALHHQGLLGADAVRRSTLDAGVDARSRAMSLPLETIEKLGLQGFDACEPDGDGTAQTVRKMYGPLTVHYKGRNHFTLTTAVEPGTAASLGIISLDVVEPN